MPCYSPLEASRATGSEQQPLIWKRGQRPSPLPKGFEAFSVPCGRCIGCRLEHSRMWGARCAHEATRHEENSFLTLTYRPEANATPEQRAKGLFLPRDLSLNKKHHQDFLKRLRYHLKGRRISYYHAGEYGDHTQRPHYHTLLFGLKFPDQKFAKEHNGHPLFTSQVLDEIWQFGHCWIGDVTFESAAYVARYCLKKQTGPDAHNHYLREDESGNRFYLQEEYATMSRNPAIGKGYYEEWAKEMFQKDHCYIPGRGVHGVPPRYYENLHSELFPDEMRIVKENRAAYQEENAAEYTPARLLAKETVKQAQLRQLPRGKI